MGTAILGQIHSCHCPQLYAQRLQEDGEDVGHENDEKEFEAVGSPGSDIGGIIACESVRRLA